MKQSYKAALFSLLLYPGSGHLLLKRYPMGLLITGTATACLGALVFSAISIAQTISDKIINGELALDSAHISAEISMQTAADGSAMTTIATWLLVFCWLAGSADAFRLGHRLDQADKSVDAA